MIMVGTGSVSSSSSTSSNASFGCSFEELTSKATVKFICSYGGKILPRYPDGKLRYVGGHTRVLAIHRSLPFSELEVKLKELCGWDYVSLRCQLPSEDLDDTLVSVSSDEDLANLFEEYDLDPARDHLLPLKIRAFLSHPSSKSPKAAVPTPVPLPSTSQTVKGSRLPPSGSHLGNGRPTDRCVRQIRPPSRFSGGARASHVHHGNHWQ